MRTRTALCLLTTLALFAAVHSEVIELNQENFNSTIEQNEYVLVMYYDPFNSLCKKFLPKFERMSANLEGVTFAKLNGEKEVDLADEQGVDDYPSFELFVWGVPIKYTKHDSVSTLREWTTNKTQIAINTASSTSDLSDTDFELYYTTASDDSPIARIMNGIQKKHEDMKTFRVPASFANQLSNTYGVTLEGEEAIFCRRKHDSHNSVYTGELNAYALESWIVANEYPDVSDFSSQTLLWLNKEELPILFFFYDPSTTNSTWVEQIRKSAPEGKGIALTVLADTNKEDVKTFTEDNGIKTFPSLVVVEPDTPNKRFLCRKKLRKITKNTLLNCLHDFEARDLRRVYKSEEPVEGLDRNVRYIVGKKFGREIFSNFEKFNLVYFYNSTTEEGVDKFKDFAEKAGIIKDFKFNVFNKDKNEHRQVLHVEPGTVLFFSPDDDNIAELKPKTLASDELLTFLEDKAPNDVYEQVHKQFN